MRFDRLALILPLRLRSLVRRAQVERDLEDEIAYHLECEVQALVDRGMDEHDARRVVLERFGAIDRAKERCRDVRGVAGIESIVEDVRYALRVFRRAPGFAIVAVLTLAMGIGANTAVFSVFDGILLSRLPYPAADRLVSVTATYPAGGFAAMREEVHTLRVAAYAEGHRFTLLADGPPVRAIGTRISAELFPLLGVKPALGRWLRSGEDVASRDAYVVLGHDLWVSLFHADPSIVGRSIRLDGQAREVIAVMPASFRFPSARTQLWVPLGIDAASQTRYWAGDYMPIVGRLEPGASMAAAAAEARAFQRRIVARFPWPMPHDWNRNIAVIPLQDAIVGSVRPQLLILLAGVAVVLVIACANVANLSLSKAVVRQREIAIRAALGAGPRRIARQLLTESLVIALAGAAAGLVLAGAITRVLVSVPFRPIRLA